MSIYAIILVVIVVMVIIMIGGSNNTSGLQKNCDRCGKPFSPEYYLDETLCHGCQNEYERAVEKEMQKRPKKQRCGECAGSGKIKGYRCVKCKGSGSVMRSEYYIAMEAISVLRLNSEWGKFACKYKNVDR